MMFVKSFATSRLIWPEWAPCWMSTPSCFKALSGDCDGDWDAEGGGGGELAGFWPGVAVPAVAECAGVAVPAGPPGPARAELLAGAGAWAGEPALRAPGADSSRATATAPAATGASAPLSRSTRRLGAGGFRLAR